MSINLKRSRRRHGRAAAIFCLGVTAAQFETMSASAEDRRSPRTASPWRSEIATSDAATPNATYAIGDRLKLMVFEQIRPDLETSQDILASAVERTELTGEYVVQEDGSIYVPLIGRVAVAGVTFKDLAPTLSTTLSAKLNARAQVGIQLIDREPVYVVGSILRPGSYKHIPGMSVQHVLALAGSLEGADADQWKLLEGARERERLLKSTDRLARAMSRLAVLQAERAGGEPAVKDLSKVVGPTNAGERLAEAEALRRSERISHEKRIKAMEAVLADYQTELALRNAKLLAVETSVRVGSERVAQLMGLRNRGVTTEANYHLATTEVQQSKERLYDAKAFVAETEHKISNLRHDRMRITTDADIDVAKEIYALRGAIREEETTRASIGALLMRMPSGHVGETAGQEGELKIVQRTTRGRKEFAAHEDSPLEPGDLLRVGPRLPGEIATR